MTQPHPRHRLLVVSNDGEFVQTVKSAVKGEDRFDVVVMDSKLAAADVDLRRDRPSAMILDVGDADADALAALRDFVRRAGEGVGTLVVTSGLDAEAARAFLRLRLSDFLVKPVTSADLLRTVRRLVATAGDEDEVSDARIYTFMPATGGAGTTTLALQTAFLLHEHAAKSKQSTCVVDLNLQHGSCAEYLDLEPRFDISEIEGQPDRLDKQLLEVMLSRHKSGLAVVSAPPCPWEMRSFRPDLVTRLLDLVATYFDHVVIDMPRTWFPWTETILSGSDRVFVVTEMTVPALRQTQRLVRAIQDRVGKDVNLGVLVNRADTRGANSGLREKDAIDVLGPVYAGRIANNYRAVREALDRGVPLRDVAPTCDVLADLRRIVIQDEQKQAKGPLSLLSPRSWIGRRAAAR